MNGRDMRFSVWAVLILCTTCEAKAAEVGSRASRAEHPDTLTALTLRGEIYGRDHYRIVHLRPADPSGQFVQLQRNGEELVMVALPRTDEEVKNFSLSRIEETAEGFRMTAEWGGGSYFYTRTFYFVFRDESFFLEQIESKSFNQRTEEQVESRKAIAPPIPFDEFAMMRFLENE